MNSLCVSLAEDLFMSPTGRDGAQPHHALRACVHVCEFTCTRVRVLACLKMLRNKCIHAVDK